jgi:hypothetical protein
VRVRWPARARSIQVIGDEWRRDGS